MRSPSQISGLLANGGLSAHSLAGSMLARETSEENVLGGHLAAAQSVLVASLFDLETIARWTQRVKRWHVTAPSLADGTPAFDDYFEAGWWINDFSGTPSFWDSYLSRFSYDITERDLLRWPLRDDLTGADEEIFFDFFTPFFIADNPISLDPGDGYKIPIGYAFWFYRHTIVSENKLEVIFRGSDSTAATSDLGETDPIYLGGATGSASFPSPVKVDNNSFTVTTTVPLNEPPGGTASWPTTFTADKFWTYGGLYDEDTGEHT